METRHNETEFKPFPSIYRVNDALETVSIILV